MHSAVCNLVVAVVSLCQWLKVHMAASGDHSRTDSEGFGELIKSHPLFPLLEYLFRQCERCTHNLNSSDVRVEMEEVMAALIKRQENCVPDQSEKLRIRLETWNDEVDELMIAAVQVLRIQLLELEKVEELCNDFCSRYTACLKGKVAQEMLMGWSDVGDDEPCSPPPSSPSINAPVDSAIHANGSPSTIMATMQTASGQVSIPLTVPSTFSAPTAASPASILSPFGSAGYKWTLNSLRDEASINFGPNDRVISTGNVIAQQVMKKGCLRSSQARRASQLAERLEHVAGAPSAGEQQCAGKRGSLPRGAVDMLRAWLFRNMRHPYPSEEEKRELCARSGLNLLQVNNWFINARRRILQPLLDVCPSRTYSNAVREDAPKLERSCAISSISWSSPSNSHPVPNKARAPGSIHCQARRNMDSRTISIDNTADGACKNVSKKRHLSEPVNQNQHEFEDVSKENL